MMRGLVLLVLCGLVVPGVLGKGPIDSGWLDREIVVDGVLGEWQDAMTKPTAAKATVGVRNDGQHLYVAFRSWDRRTNFMVLTRGLILRLTPKGKKSSAVGIRFPVGLPPLSEEARQASPPGRPSREQIEQRMREAEASLDVLEILETGEDSGPRQIIDGSLGFEIEAVSSDGMVTYELKIPLKHLNQDRFGLASGPGQTVTMNLETPTIDVETLRSRMGNDDGLSGPSPGGRTGSGGLGGPTGGRGGMGRDGRPSGRSGGFLPSFDGLKIKTKIRLATGDAN